MPTCPICEKQVSIFSWDIFGRSCVNCMSMDRNGLNLILDTPCPECGSDHLYATSAPGLAYVKTKNGVIPSKTAPGLFIVGCSDCGHAYLKFNREGAAALTSAPGWLRRNADAHDSKSDASCPKCDSQLNFHTRVGITITDDDPPRIFCAACKHELLAEDV